MNAKQNFTEAELHYVRCIVNTAMSVRKREILARQQVGLMAGAFDRGQAGGLLIAARTFCRRKQMGLL